MRNSTRRGFLICAGVLLLLVGGTVPVDARNAEVEFRAALSLYLAQEEWRAVAALYARRRAEPVWYGYPGRYPVAIAALRRAAEHGIRDATIAAALDAPEPWPSDPAAAARRELNLTRAILREATALAGLRLDPQRLYPDWAIERLPHDLVAELADALDYGALAEWLDQLPPRRAEYTALLAGFAQYRALASEPAWSPLREGDILKPGGIDPVLVPQLRLRLAAEGYKVETGGHLLDDALAGVVADFQRRHGLADDGTVGPRTIAALNVPAAARAETVRLNLERWRWMRGTPTARLVVNAASAVLTVREEERAVLSMRTIVGDQRHPTPMFESRIEAVILNPAWDVPRSITRREILPRVAREPDYLERNDMMIRGRDARGMPRLRQLPGPKNALGKIKLEIPSRFDVYLHDTPDRKLFARALRALSHGCIRLEAPLALAAYVLRGQGAWDEPRLIAAIGEGKTRRIPVSTPLPVEIGYWTAFVDEAGAVNFRDDIYGRDAVLRDALDAAERDAAAVLPEHVAVSSSEAVGCRSS
jgi:murein L,D-transpeptidase YcbB/YkuD